MKLTVISLLLTFLVAPQVQKKENDLSTELLRGKVKARTETWYSVGSNNKRLFVKKTRTEYNPEGLKTKITNIDQWNKDIKSWDYKYDSKGNPISDSPERGKIIQTAKDGSWTETIRDYSSLITVKKYGKDGLLLERLTTDQQGKTLSSAKMTNNKLGQRIKEEDFNADGTLSQTILNTYDTYGNLTEISYLNSKSKQTGKTTYAYSPNNGPLIEYVSYLIQMGSLQRFKTTKFSRADHKNNWLQSIETQDGEPPFLKIRELEYYPD